MKATVTAIANENGIKDIYFSARSLVESEIKDFSKKMKMKMFRNLETNEYVSNYYANLRGSIKKGNANETGTARTISLYKSGAFEYVVESKYSATKEEFEKLFA